VREILPSKKLSADASRGGYRADVFVFLCLGREGLSPKRCNVARANSPAADLGIQSTLSFLSELVSLERETH